VEHQIGFSAVESFENMCLELLDVRA